MAGLCEGSNEPPGFLKTNGTWEGLKKGRVDKCRDNPPQNPDQSWDQVLATWGDLAEDQNYFRDVWTQCPKDVRQ
ncbi:hypothetical protein ANN_06533 [Periplaneta americana]|uniref:Secreted protein n=1 Tax=Periplaneta americana TaxID=6978 RepID=A0ABQ8TFE5_PERAM|nr:hypothetical protein ANN_06533 [Periplaneta americana]